MERLEIIKRLHGYTVSRQYVGGEYPELFAYSTLEEALRGVENLFNTHKVEQPNDR
jgi:hypothetical protein